MQSQGCGQVQKKYDYLGKSEGVELKVKGMWHVYYRLRCARVRMRMQHGRGMSEQEHGPVAQNEGKAENMS